MGLIGSKLTITPWKPKRGRSIFLTIDTTVVKTEADVARLIRESYMGSSQEVRWQYDHDRHGDKTGEFNGHGRYVRRPQ